MTNSPNLWQGNPIEFSSRGPSCPHCRATASIVKDSRQHHEADGSTYVRRRRECQECRKRFTTFELGSRITKLPPDIIRGLRTLRQELDRLLNLPTVTFGDD